MDRIEERRQLIKRLLQEYADYMPCYADVQAQTIFDDEHSHYLLFYTGWDGKHRVHGNVLHIDLHSDGKVWVQHDGTKDGIVDELLETGIPQQEIVLGFHHPGQRKFTEFAVS